MLVSVCFCCCSVNPRLEESTMEQGDEGLLHYWWCSWLYLWAYVPINIPVLSPQLGGKKENDLIKQEQQCGSNFTHYPLPYFSSHALKLQNGKPVPCSASCCSPGRGWWVHSPQDGSRARFLCYSMRDIRQPFGLWKTAAASLPAVSPGHCCLMNRRC